MKTVFAAFLALSATVAFAGSNVVKQTETTKYGTRSDGTVVPTSKTTATKMKKEKPQQEEMDSDSDSEEKTETKTTKKVR